MALIVLDMEYQIYYYLILFHLIKKESEANTVFDYSMMDNANRIIAENANDQLKKPYYY